MTSAATSGGHRQVARAETRHGHDRPPAPAQVFWESTGTLLAVLDVDGAFVAGNPAWQRLLGWPESSLLRTTLLELVHPADVRRVGWVLDARPNGPRPDVALRLRGYDGGYATVEVTATAAGDLCFVAAEHRSAAPAAPAAPVPPASGPAGVDVDLAPAPPVVREHVAVLDEAGRVLATDGSVEDEDYLARWDAIGSGRYAASVASGLRALLAGTHEHLTLDHPVDERWFRLHAARLRGTGPPLVVVSHLEVTDRRWLEDVTRTQAALLDELDAAVIASDLEDRVTSWNRGAERLFGTPRHEALGRPLADLVQQVPQDDPAHLPAGEVIACDDGTSRVTLRRPDGTVLAAQVRNRALVDASGARIGGVSVCFDVSAQIRAEREVLNARNYLAAVTDSMGEGLFALDGEGRVTVMNAAAEALLGWSFEEMAGQRMHEVIHHRYPDGRPFPRAECAMQRVHVRGETLRLMADVFVRRDGLDLPVTYTAAPLDGDDGAFGCVVVFIDATEVHAEQQRLAAELNELAWVQRLRRVLDDDLFELFAQPIVRLDTGEVTQHELLLRVRRSDGTFAPPGEYLRTAEEHGLIGEVDRWVIQQALGHAAAGMHVELNISAGSVGDEQLLGDIERWLVDSAADPALVVFEITETALITDETAGRAFVQRLHELGCKVALDDFGTGYGGFTYLKQLPVHYLKIDIEFVRDLCHNEASRHVVKAVVNLARGFGLLTVAEGVEDQATLELLRDLGVDFAQGYHIGRPGPITTAG